VLRGLAWGTVLLLTLTGVGSAASLRVNLEGPDRALLTEESEIFLEAMPRNGEGMLGFAQRTTGSASKRAVISEANRGRTKLLKGIRYRVPLEELRPELQLEVLLALFPEDRVMSVGWRHQVLNAQGREAESLWTVARWFAGRGEAYRELRDANGLRDNNLVPGQPILIPRRLLRPSLRSRLPETPAHGLEYGEDERGSYAVYKLRKGEALYSSVVIRFTGRVFADDVNALAAEVAERSEIADVTDIPVGYRVKVPSNLLLPEFLPLADPRRQEYEQALRESSRFSNSVRAASLQGVQVILDSGHGGIDVGASRQGIWESVYVYDIMLRTKSLLEAATAARVTTLTMDGSSYSMVERDVLPASRGHRVLTTPNYPIQDSTVGIHLRWYLANSIFRRHAADGDPAKVVFISIHADSLHPSLRGAMAYVPGARYRQGSYGKSGAVYASREEVREKPSVSFSYNARVKSEGLSRELAERVMASFEAKGLAVHDDKPIRDRVVRSRRAWVPAVLRYNEVPAQFLLEVCNLANSQDYELLQTRDFRQRVAESIVAGIADYYGEPQPVADQSIAGK
jgi:N-acetylmuramoyl-L-alanine amidase